MKGYRHFMFIFLALFILYIIAELSRPTPIDWTVTISKNDKNPYGGYIIYNRLKDLFPGVAMRSYHLPLYNQLNKNTEKNTAYMILTPAFEPSRNDYEEMMRYVSKGNYIVVSAASFNRLFFDSLRLGTTTRFLIRNKDSAAVNFVNPLLKSKKGFTFLPYPIDGYFSKFDTLKTIVIGVNDKDQPDFIKNTIW